MQALRSINIATDATRYYLDGRRVDPGAFFQATRAKNTDCHQTIVTTTHYKHYFCLRS
jgi:hypothetical protein